jgi:capping protein alpha
LTYAREHYPSSTNAIFPTSSDSAIAILLVANKYSPSNFWYHLFFRLSLPKVQSLSTNIRFLATPFRNGRIRTTYIYDPSSYLLSGTVRCDVHYYEDGNVRLTTRKSVNPTTISPSSSAISSSSAASAIAVEVVKAIADLEGKYQRDLNHGFAKLSEGEFKALRRPLPVTRQKVDWEKIGGYRVSSGIHICSKILRADFFSICVFVSYFRPVHLLCPKFIPLFSARR